MPKPALFTALAAFLLLAANANASSSPNLLTNGDFETGDTSGWSALGGDVGTTSSSATGLWAAQLTSNGVDAVARMWQWQPVQALATYRFSASARLSDSNVDRVVLRIQWLNSGGAEIGGEDSPWLQYGTVSPDSYTTVSTASVPAPATATAARLSGLAYGVDGDQFFAFFDDFAFVQTAAPPPTPVHATPSPPPAPANPVATTPTASSSPTPRPTRTPVNSITNTPSPPPEIEPAVFPALVNSGFEQPGQDGPYGWRKIGGTLSQTTAERRSGEYSATLVSSTASTKWVYQSVAVGPGAHYRASAYAFQANDPPGHLFLRLSWYASTDGSGESISSDDSTGVISANTPAFALISTDSVQAPADAHSVRVRLMFRPASADTAVAYFDDVSFGPATAPAVIEATSDRSASAGFIAESGPEIAAAQSNVVAGKAAPGSLHNGSGQTVHELPPSRSSGGGNQWLLWLALALPLTGITTLLAVPYLRSRPSTPTA